MPKTPAWQRKEGKNPKGGNAKAMLKQKGSYKDKDNNKDKDKDKDKFNAVAFMCDLGYNESLVKEWFEVRKLKKLKNTETALTGFNNEVLKTNKPVNEILKTCVEKSWGGFKNEWLTKEKESDNPLINAINQMYNK